MFYPRFQRLSFTYLQFTPQVRFNILSQVLWEWISGARVALSGNDPLPPNSLYSERTEREEICYKKSVLEPVTGVQKVDRGGQIERAKKQGWKKGFFASFLLRASPHLDAWNFAIHFITD